MELLPTDIERSLPPLYATEGCSLADKVVRLKLFCPWNPWTWYAVEYDPEQRLFFGLVRGFEVEWGYWTLDELEQIRGPGGLRIERDVHFAPQTVKELARSEGIEGAY